MKLSFKCLALGVLTGTLWFYSGDGFPQNVPLSVIVAEQRDAPVSILSTFVEVSNPLSPRYGYSITNLSDKAITALAIQESANIGPGAPSVSTSFTHFPTVKLLLGPHQSMPEEGGNGRRYDRAPFQVTLSLDFVEFADGTRWGEDISRSGEMLDGKRAGGKAALKKYREILSSHGINGVTQSLGKSDLVRPETNAQSDAWLRGFNMGVTSTRGRLTRAKTNNGDNGVLSELDKPFDSMEGRREP